MIITKNSLPSSNIGTIFLPQAKARQAHAFPREGHRVGTTTTLLPSKSQAIPPTRVGAMHKYVLTMLSMPNASQGLPKPRTAWSSPRTVYRVATLAQFSCHKQKHGKPMHSHERVTESGQQQPYCQAKARQSHPRGWELCTNTCLPCPMPAKACPSQEQHDHHQFPHKFIQISIFWSNSIKNVHEFDWNDEKSNEIAGENTLRRSFCLPAVPIGAPRACRAYPHTHPPPIYDWKAIFSFVEKVHFFPCIHKFLKVLKSGPRRRIFFWIFLWLLGTLKQAKPRKNRNIPMSDELITNFSAETSQRADTT